MFKCIIVCVEVNGEEFQRLMNAVKMLCFGYDKTIEARVGLMYPLE